MSMPKSHRIRLPLAMALSLLTGLLLVAAVISPTRTILLNGFASAATSLEFAGDWERNPVTGHDVWVPNDICNQPWQETFDISVAELENTIALSYD